MAVSVRSTAHAGPTAGALSIAKPAGLVVGDILIAHLSCAGAAFSTPSGWTALGNNGAGPVQTVLWKRADAADVAASTFAFGDPGSDNEGYLIAVRGPKLADPTVVSAAGGGSGTSVSFTGLTPAAADSLLLFLINVAGNATITAEAIATSNPSWTEVYDAFNTNRMSAASANRAAATATGNATATLGNSAVWGARLVSIAPGENVSIEAPLFTTTLFLFQTFIPTPVLTMTVSLLNIVMSKWRAVGKRTLPSWENVDKTD